MGNIATSDTSDIGIHSTEDRYGKAWTRAPEKEARTSSGVGENNTMTENAKNNLEFSSTDIELFSAIYAITRREPAVFRDLSTGFGCFTTIYSDEVQNVINAYSTGKLMVNARDLLMTRRKLFRAVKALSGGAR